MNICTVGLSTIVIENLQQVFIVIFKKRLGKGESDGKQERS